MNASDPAAPRLLQAVLDGTATAEQHGQLAELLRTDARVRAEYVQQMRLDALLHFTGGAVAKKTDPAQPDAPATPRPAAPAPRPGFRFSPLLFAAAAVALLLSSISALWWSRRGVEVEIIRAAEIGHEAGLRYVYAGNLPGSVREYESTYCPQCNYQLVKRSGYIIREYKITSAGACPKCGEKIAGVWHSDSAQVQLNQRGYPLPL